MLFGGADEERAGAPPDALRVHVHVDVSLAGLRAVVDDSGLGGAEYLPVLLGDQRLEVGSGMGVRDVVRDARRCEQEEGERYVPDAGEGFDAGLIFGAEGSHGHCHELGRYAGRYGGCLSFSGRYGTIAA